ncbi:unnamed protein product, partial [Musa hybrid cultivar]
RRADWGATRSLTASRKSERKVFNRVHEGSTSSTSYSTSSSLPSPAIESVPFRPLSPVTLYRWLLEGSGGEGSHHGLASTRR